MAKLKGAKLEIIICFPFYLGPERNVGNPIYDIRQLPKYAQKIPSLGVFSQRRVKTIIIFKE
ncbi:MAG: hypothetical protein JRD93_16230 [Deltaproteobacteria bacterium]|nr:hypothetical protein [Deltaproteobacteria bacterium]